MRLLAIDPGNTHSGWVLVDTPTCRPVAFGKDANDTLRALLFGELSPLDHVAVEMIASYGMPVGKEVFETCVWIGRFAEVSPVAPQLVYRREVKLHHCGSSKANDSNIRQALVDRFTPGEKNHGKGTKSAPGWFYGFHADVWQAMALAVLVADQLEGRAA